MASLIPNEILQEIFKCDFTFLYSSLLVNKRWSQNVVSILWERPFHLFDQKQYHKSYKIITTYISCEYDVNSKIFLEVNAQRPLYNYSSYLRHLHCFNFFKAVQQWCDENNTESFRRIIIILFRQFAAYSSKLETLDMKMVGVLFEKNEYTFSNTEVSKWISSIREINLGLNIIDDQKFFNLYEVCNNISKVSSLNDLKVLLLK